MYSRYSKNDDVGRDIPGAPPNKEMPETNDETSDKRRVEGTAPYNPNSGNNDLLLIMLLLLFMFMSE